MSLDPKDVQHIAGLARLHVPDEDTPQVTEQLQKIVAFVAQLDAVDTDGVVPMAHPLGDVTAALRPDTPVAVEQRERYQNDAPDTADGFYRVPKVIE